jgi:hypothetical protein
MKKRQHQKMSPTQRSSAHLDHLGAQEDHSQWLTDLEHWRSGYQAAVLKFARQQLPELELANFEDALDRHEAAIMAHQELANRHEQRLRREESGQVESSEEAAALHEQMHERHELSRLQHDELARSHRAILKAMAMFETDR